MPLSRTSLRAATLTAVLALTFPLLGGAPAPAAAPRLVASTVLSGLEHP